MSRKYRSPALCAAVLGVISLSIGTASAATPVGEHDRTVPFTSASVATGSPGTLIVSWRLSGRESVLVRTGTSSSTTTHVAARGGSSGRVQIPLRPGAAPTWVELVPSRGRSLVLGERDLGLASDPNLRDVGGYRTTDGQWVRSGVVFRSQALALTPADLATVDTLGIGADLDLRTPAEATAVPDAVPVGATYRMLNVLGTDAAPSPLAADPAAARQVMRDIETAFVTSAASRRAIGTLLTTIARGRTADLVHCTAGKDRTGWATAVLLTLLGVPARTVMHDYLLSNRYYFRSPAVQAKLASLPTATRAVYTEFVRVEPSYLQAGLDQIHASYGSTVVFANRGLGLSRATIRELRRRLLVGAPVRR